MTGASSFGGVEGAAFYGFHVSFTCCLLMWGGAGGEACSGVFRVVFLGGGGVLSCFWSFGCFWGVVLCFFYPLSGFGSLFFRPL